jgi:acyl dehydratase
MADRELAAPPSMVPLLARAAVSLLPGASRLPFIPGNGSEIAPGALTISGMVVDRARLAAYDRVCGFRLSDTLPPTYVHMLAFPLHLAVMTAGSFPLPAIGLVHIANRIVQHRPLQASEPVSLRVWATAIQPHPRGLQFAIHTEARAGTEVVWEETSTNLKRGDRDDSVPDPEAPPSSEALPATATWTLPGDLGRRYASVSGDRNPIHLHALTARPFGFHSAIAHGMWTMARSLAALGPELGDSFTVQVAFKRPIPLPATVQFAERSAADAIVFGVRDARRDVQHLDGQVRFSV